MIRKTATITNTEVPPEVAAAISRKPIKIRVRLKKRQNGNYALICSHPLPNSNLVRRLMPAKHASDISTNWFTGIDLEYALNQTRGIIKPREWLKAIARAIELELGSNDKIEYELLAVRGGGFLALGNALFEIHAVDHIEHGPKALPVLRKQVIETAKVEAASVLAAAREADRAIRHNAEVHRIGVQIECNKLVAEHAKYAKDLALAIPQWMRDANIPCR